MALFGDPYINSAARPCVTGSVQFVQMNDPVIKQSTIGGTLFSLLGIIVWDELGKTIALSAIGATVSFAVSHALRYIASRRKRKA
jgi:hypothetical protein